MEPMEIVQRILLGIRNTERSDPLAPGSLEEEYVLCIVRHRIQFSPAWSDSPIETFPCLMRYA
jgi:hypothetical protein